MHIEAEMVESKAIEISVSAQESLKRSRTATETSNGPNADRRSAGKSLVKGLNKFLRQLRFVCSKSVKLQLRYWKSTLLQSLIVPILLVVLLYILKQAVNNLVTSTILRPPSSQLRGVSKCSTAYRSSLPCITVMYSKPSGAVGTTIDSIMSNFVSLNNARLGRTEFSVDSSAWTPSVTLLPSGNLGVLSVPSDDFIYDFAESNPNVTNWAISFSTAPASFDNQLTLFQYQLWYNYTTYARNYRVQGAPPYIISAVEPFNDNILSMMRAIDEAIIATLSASDPNTNFYEVYLKDFPDIPDGSAFNCPRNPDASFRTLGPIFLFVPISVVFFSTISTITNEKEKGLKEAMQLVGLKPSVYWFGYFITTGVVVVINAFVTVLTGYIINFSFFTNTDFGLLVLFFVMYGFASVSFAFFLSGVLSRVKAAIGAAFFFVIIGVIYISLGSIATYAWYSDYNDPNATDMTPGWKILMFFPFFNYSKFIQDVLSATLKRPSISGTTCSIVNGFSYSWDSLNEQIKIFPGALSTSDPKLTPYTGQSLWFFFMNIIVWALLGYYFDRVIPNENGYSEHPLFFLLPKGYGRATEDKSTLEGIKYDGEDEDVTKERAETKKYETGEVDPSKCGLRISGLHKVYYSVFEGLERLFGVKVVNGKQDPTQARRVALGELSLNVNKGDLLALLGSNGAGKTTTMKILYGSSAPTAGNAWIFGYNIRTEMDEIRKILGVCPQFDVLFPDLTAKEHIELFGGIKGIKKSELDRVMEERLKHVKLWDVRNQRSGQYSGGMKRRLSVILSTIGDPKCLFLDEPTTGMDPSNRRFVWSFLEQFKKGRVIVLTTHSLDEADTLGDKIAIMTKGKLRAVGKSIHLKNKYGTGYRVSMNVPRAINVPKIKKAIEESCPQATLDEEERYGGGETKGNYSEGMAVRLVYAAIDMKVVKKLVELLENWASESNNVSPLISSFGMSQTSLEDVFMRMVKAKYD